MADENKHVLAHIDFNGDSIDIQDAIARQAVSEVSKEIAELTKNAVTNIAQGISDYTIRVTKDGLAIDVPIKGLSSKLEELAQAIEDTRKSIPSLDSPEFTGIPKAPTASSGSDSTQIANTKFVQLELAAQSTAQQDAIDAAYENANKYTDKKVADLVDGAPETMDTLKEVAEAIQANKDVETALNEAIGKKANQTELDTHTSNSTIHITASERANYHTAYEHSQAKHARTDATKVEKSTTNGNILIDGVESNVYSHPGTGTNPHGTTKSDVGLGNVGNFKAVSTVANQQLTEEEQAAARANIGAGTSTTTGTITEVKMNGKSVATSGVADLGTVLTGGSQTSTSDIDGGSNVYTFSDGSTLTVKNGAKGADGITPIIKVAAGANIDSVGTPSVSASTVGTVTTITFNNLKGQKGDTGSSGTVVQSAAPSDTTKLWCDSKSGITYYYNGSKWTPITSTWG